MAVGGSSRLRWRYTDNNGYVWALSADAYITAQVNGEAAVLVGGEAAPQTDPSPYCSFRKRRVVCHDPNTGRSRVVTLFAADAPLAVKGTTIQLNEANAAGLVAEQQYISSGRVLPEGSGRSTTYQTT